MEKQIDCWEEKRFWASALILSSMHANFNNRASDLSFLAKDAVKTADALIRVLKEDSKVSE